MQFWGTYRGFSHSGPVDSKLKNRFYYPNDFDAHDQGDASGDGSDASEIEYDTAQRQWNDRLRPPRAARADRSAKPH
jgi:hypothetical protein